MTLPILITGAAGHVGQLVAGLLAAQGHPLRLLGRQPTKVVVPPGANATVVAGDYADPASLDAAFAGVGTAFIVSGYAEPGERAKLHRNAFEAAARVGVRHVVYLSAQGAAPDSKFPMARDHYQSEQYLRATGLPYTALRDCLYLDLLPELFDQAGVVRAPAGDGAAAFVARPDVARVVAALHAAPPPRRSQTLDVTGPEALTLAAAARRLATLVGRPLRYEVETPAARAWRGQLGAPAWEVATWVGSYEAIAAGERQAVHATVQQFTGRPPLTLEAYFGQYPALLAELRK